MFPEIRNPLCPSAAHEAKKHVPALVSPQDSLTQSEAALQAALHGEDDRQVCGVECWACAGVFVSRVWMQSLVGLCNDGFSFMNIHRSVISLVAAAAAAAAAAVLVLVYASLHSIGSSRSKRRRYY